MLKSIFGAGAPTSIESLSPLCFVASGSTIMPKKDMKAAQDNSWVKETHARVHRMQQQIDQGHDGSNISNDSWERVATQPIYDLRSGSAHTESRSAPLSGQETAELAYRMSGEALTKSIFIPWKNTSMICGRPVQVLNALIDLQWSWGEYVSKQVYSLLSFVTSRVSLSPCAFLRACRLMWHMHEHVIFHEHFVCPLIYPQLLILTHECGDTRTAASQTAGTHFAPLQPLCMYGRSATLGTPCQKDHSVTYGWRDRFAFMMSLWVCEFEMESLSPP